MIVLDTNVVSALMQVAPDRKVIAWLDSQPTESIWITTVTLFETWLGIGLLPAGRRQRELEASFDRLVEEDLESRILHFDDEAAVLAAELSAARQRKGMTIDVRDTFIAGIALSRRATIATRNVRHFKDIGVPIVDPWHA